MLLRRLSENIRAQNWTAICLDLVIVILGIFLGLQASEWYAGRQEIVIEDSILQRLKAEFNDISNDARSAVLFHQNEVGALEVVYRSLRAKKLEPVDEAQFNLGLQSAMSYELGPSRSVTYIEILSSGQFRLLRNQELRAALSKYDDFVIKADSLFESFQINQRKHETAFNRHLVRGPVRELNMDSSPTGLILTHGDIVDFDFDAMAEDEEFVDSIQRLIEYHTNFQFWHINISRSASQVVGLLNSHRD